MPINPEAVGAKGEPTTRSWTSKDALLYAVGIGGGTDELHGWMWMKKTGIPDFSFYYFRY